MPSLYQDLGGESAIDATVDLFYEKILSDDRIKHFFDGLDMQRQKDMQRKFLTVAFGGPANYDGRAMREAHKKPAANGLNDGHFDAVIEDLGATLKELGVPDDKIAEAAAVAESVRGDILNH